MNKPVEPSPVVVIVPVLVVTVPGPVVLAVTPYEPTPEVVFEVVLTSTGPPLETAKTPLLLSPVVVSAPQLIVTEPVPLV